MSKKTSSKNTGGISSVASLKEHLFAKFFRWFFSLSPTCKLTVIVVFVFLFVLAARAGFFGETVHSLARRALPFTIPIVDGEPPDILLDFTFEVDDGTAPTTAKVGGTYRSGDRVYLSVNSNVECWLSVFCVDSKGVYGVYNQSCQPGLFEPQDKAHVMTFVLDDTIGPEVYFAVVSHRRFNFAKQIEPKLRDLFPEMKAKGPVFSRYRLDLGAGYYQAVVYFDHRERRQGGRFSG
jgi:hypothetical protein